MQDFLAIVPSIELNKLSTSTSSASSASSGSGGGGGGIDVDGSSTSSRDVGERGVEALGKQAPTSARSQALRNYPFQNSSYRPATPETPRSGGVGGFEKFDSAGFGRSNFAPVWPSTSPASAFYGVFDGHGENGEEASRQAGVKMTLFVKKNLGLSLARSDVKIVDSTMAAALSNNTSASEQDLSIRGLLTEAFEQVDRDICAQVEHGGTTANVVLIQDSILWVANAGDSRCVLSCKGIAIPLSKDHSPEDDEEKTRIEDLGGRVVYCGGSWRVEGSLSVTRSLGNCSLKKYVSSTPDVIKRGISEDDEFLILASDGIWKVLDAQEAVDVVSSAMAAARRLGSRPRKDGDFKTFPNRFNSKSKRGDKFHSPGATQESIDSTTVGSEALVNEALRRLSMDNISVVLVLLDKYRHGPKTNTATPAHEFHTNTATPAHEFHNHNTHKRNASNGRSTQTRTSKKSLGTVSSPGPAKITEIREIHAGGEDANGSREGCFCTTRKETKGRKKSTSCSIM